MAIDQGNGAMGLDDEYQDTADDDERLADDPPHPARQPVGRRPLVRRLIEQARERQELSRSLADFDDYLK
jgi:hypothetical protein